MAALPSHLVPATRVRRLWVGLANLFFAGLAILIGELLGDHTLGAVRFGVNARLYSIAALSVLWVLCVIQKKSLGATVSLVEIRSRDGEKPQLAQVMVRSLPVYFLAVAGVFPSELLPSWIAILQLALFCVLLVVTLSSGIAAMVTCASLFDRISRTVIVQLALPNQMKAGVFGIK